MEAGWKGRVREREWIVQRVDGGCGDESGRGLVVEKMEGGSGDE